MVPGRADVICCGALIARRVASHIAPDLTVSEADILDGMVLGLVRSAQL
jgi:exopolyphosphatase/guanosine-5'-triphosphate,3'-diphosphate pyrophosphatase